MRKIALLTCATLLSSCGFSMGNGGSITSSHQIHVSVHQSFNTSANPSVSVSNVSGNISVTGWAQSKVQIDIDKYGEKSSDIANSEIVIDHTSDDVSVKTQYARGMNRRGGEVYYTLHIPKDAQLKIENVSGGETIQGVAGTLDAQTVSGRITADSLTTDTKAQTTSGRISLEFATAPKNGTIKAQTVSGPITLIIPAGINADVETASVAGGFRSDFPSVLAKKQDVGSKASGTIGSGGTTIKLETVSGSIELRKK